MVALSQVVILDRVYYRMGASMKTKLIQRKSAVRARNAIDGEASNVSVTNVELMYDGDYDDSYREAMLMVMGEEAPLNDVPMLQCQNCVLSRR